MFFVVFIIIFSSVYFFDSLSSFSLRSASSDHYREMMLVHMILLFFHIFFLFFLHYFTSFLYIFINIVLIC